MDTIKKLELKHLAPYLASSLLCDVIDFDGNKWTNCELTSISTDSSYEHFTFMYNNEMPAEVSMVHVENIKPILRPLSDLTKEIEHNSKRFVPAMVLWSVSLEEEEDFIIYRTVPNYWKTSAGLMKHNINKCDYGDVQKLHEWHFDTQNLIESGLAIDINTLES